MPSRATSKHVLLLQTVNVSFTKQTGQTQRGSVIIARSVTASDRAFNVFQPLTKLTRGAAQRPGVTYRLLEHPHCTHIKVVYSMQVALACGCAATVARLEAERRRTAHLGTAIAASGKRLRAVCVKKAGLCLARDQPVCPAGGLSFILWAHARASSPGQCGCPPGAPSLTRRPHPGPPASSPRRKLASSRWASKAARSKARGGHRVAGGLMSLEMASGPTQCPPPQTS